MASYPSIPKINAGGGRISLASYGSSAVFTELTSTYPLKLLSPRVTRRGVAIVYLLTYGGGLVGGDHVELFVNIDSNTVLVLLSQGFTKVFKFRPGQRLASTITNPTPMISNSISKAISATKQIMRITIATEGFLFLLPDPVTCFRSASYSQTQTFYLSRNASLVALDWLTPGRIFMGEEWVFSRYYSANEVWIDGKRIVKDVMLLEDEHDDLNAKLPPRKTGDRLAPYSCYAVVILYGPQVRATILHVAAQYEEILLFQAQCPPEMVWCLSLVASGQGAIVKVAGKETEVVKGWLSQALVQLQETIGIDVYRKAFQ